MTPVKIQIRGDFNDDTLKTENIPDTIRTNNQSRNLIEDGDSVSILEQS